MSDSGASNRTSKNIRDQRATMQVAKLTGTVIKNYCIEG